MAFRQWEMVPSRSATGYGPAGTLYRFRGECGSGEYWAYFHGKLFAINAFDLRFSARGVFRYRHAEHLSIAHYDRTDLDVRSSFCPTGNHVIGTYIADEGAEYVARCERGAVSRATSITISPDYYRLYLRERFGDIPNIRKAFKLVNGSRDFPALAALFRQIRAYRGRGIGATLFYEGAVAETVALVLDRAGEIERREKRGTLGEDLAGTRPPGLRVPPRRLAAEDARSLNEVETFIRHNLDACLDCQTLSCLACMGRTKFKTLFRQRYGCTPAAFVKRIRMERAMELLSDTDLPIRQISRRVGYAKPSAFTKAFSGVTGVLPSAMRG